jgi:hypothetical protein
MAGYIEGVRTAVFSGTAATNLTDAEISALMNQSIKTNLAAQLWYRQAMTGKASAEGAQISMKIRVLETLRTGRTEEALRLLEDGLDSDIISLGTFVKLSDETQTFKTTPGPVKSLQWAKEYRQKFPYKSGNAGTDEQVREGLAYRAQK